MWFQPEKKLRTSLLIDVDFLSLCKINVLIIENLVSGGNLLNQRQCQDLSSKLSSATQNVGELVLSCGASSACFRAALKDLYRYLETAKVLVSKCGDEDWSAAAVFQSLNENAFREILLDVSLCYNAIYEQANSMSKDRIVLPHDLRQSSMFEPTSDSHVDEDKQDLLKRLDELANGHTNYKGLDYWIPGRGARKQSLAKYLLVKLYCTSKEPQADTLDSYSAMLWTKVSEPSGTWGNSRFLGAGSGASGVCSTEWLGIPCAKKEFHGKESESFFMKEAGILAHLKHPCIVNLICCGNGLKRGDRFIAMELMEMSLFDLIEEQKDVHFSLSVAVDMMVQIASGVRYLHGRGVAHRDLKPQNVVVNRVTSTYLSEDHYCVKLVDFGMSKTKVEVSKSNTMTARGIGTTRYRAPEVFPQAHPDGKGKATWFKADVYGFAMTCAHLLSLKTPFGEMLNLSELHKKLMNGERPKLPVECPQELVVLLEDCWNIKPASRPSFTEICIKLEKFRHAFLRRNAGANERFHEDTVDFSVGFDFIERIVNKQSAIQTPLVDSIDEEEEGKTYHGDLPILPCTSGHELEFLPQLPSWSNGRGCNICWESIVEEHYQCRTCDFDAHSHCSKLELEVNVFFHKHPLHLLIRNYYNDNADAICCFCEESLQQSEWVYRCEQCDFDVHALCVKYPEERMWNEWHEHRLILIQCPPRKSVLCACCNGEVRGNTWRYTCTERGCTFDVHPSCVTIFIGGVLCIFDNSHRLSLARKRRGFHCGSCGALGLSWCYHCDGCDVDVHLDCIHDMEEEYSWNEVYEGFTAQDMTKDGLTQVDMIARLLDKLLVTNTSEGSSSSTSRLSPVLAASTMQVQQTIRRLPSSEIPGLDAVDFDDVDVRRKIIAETGERKALRTTAKVRRLELQAKYLEMLENLERIVVDLRSSESVLEDNGEAVTSTLEKLEKGRYIVEEEMASLAQSRMRHGPRTCLFFLYNEDRGVYELLTGLRPDMEDVTFLCLCEEPGHQHDVEVSLCRVFQGALGEDRLQKLQPLLACGLEVVARAMNTVAGQLTRLDCVTLPCLGSLRWDLRAIDVERHGKPSHGNENVKELKRAVDCATEWILSDLEESGVNIYKTRGLVRVRYKVTEEGDFPGYTRGSVAWLCDEHLNRGLEAGILESYPVKYYNPELN